jgi:hypothetical protein
LGASRGLTKSWFKPRGCMIEEPEFKLRNSDCRTHRAFELAYSRASGATVVLLAAALKLLTGLTQGGGGIREG